MTRAERLQAVCDRIGKNARYEIDELGTGLIRVRVEDRLTGDTVGGVGLDLDAALAVLETKVPKQV